MPLRLSDLSGRKVGIWGGGREGLAAAKALSRLAAPPDLVVAADEIPLEQADTIRRIYPEATLFAGPGSQKELARCEVVIRSPGVSPYNEAFRELAAAGVEVTSGTNLWFAERPDVITVGITGTKGKSTTSSLTAHILRSHFRVVLAGNIGVPLLDTLELIADSDVFVIELSSHQVSDLELRPSVSLVLNLFPEHLQWHGSWERYYSDKLRLLEDETTAVANYASPPLREAIQASRLTVTWFNAPETIRAADDGIWQSTTRLYPAEALSLLGRHNRSNAAAALTVAAKLGLDAGSLGKELSSFEPLAHRLQRVGEFGGRVFINDSISTTPESTLAALDALEAIEIVLLAGGTDREQDYKELARRLIADERVQAVVGLPETGEKLLAAVRSHQQGQRLQLLSAQTVEEAVAYAVDVSGSGAIVLLSPAAPSYGVYRNFEERGERFAAAARYLSSD